MSETPDAFAMETVEAPAPEPAFEAVPEVAPARKASGRRTGGRASGTGRRSSGPRARRAPRAPEAPPAPATPAAEPAGSLAAALRGLVDGIDAEVSAITALSEEIDDHVAALNDLRAQATERLLHLDELRAAAEDVNLSAFLDTTIAPQLPQIEEEFPDRIYGG